MSAPFGGPPALPFNTADGPRRLPRRRDDPIHRDLAALPRRASTTSGTTRRAKPTPTCTRAPQGVHDFLRAYYHHKSADWKANQPYPAEIVVGGNSRNCRPTTSWILPKDMAETVAHEMPTPRQDRRQQMAARQRACASTPPNISATDSRAACNGIAAAPRRVRAGAADLVRPHHRHAAPPSSPGKQDWGTYQRPGVFEAMQTQACTNMIGCHLVDGAGHWVQQEQAEVSRLLLAFLRDATRRAG